MMLCQRLPVVLLFATISLFACGQSGNVPAITKSRLDSGASASEILSDALFDSVRTETSFREIIKQHASPVPVTMIMAKEVGERITVKGRLSRKDQPLANMLIYVYQTDTRGWYGSDRVHFQMMEEYRRHARLFAYLRTNAKGEFEINTTQPHGYPQSDLPDYIHFEVFDGERALLISELLFDDDESLQGETSKPTTRGSQKFYNYVISVR